MSRRDQYLAALGIDVWTLRDAARLGAAATLPAAAAATAATARTASTAAMAVAPAVPTAAAPPAPLTAEDAAAWQMLEEQVRSCTQCALHATRTNAVFGVGNRRAEVMVIGEAPGAEEDRQGEPFVGRAGQLLNSMIRALGFARGEVYIANVLKSRPPGNRDPLPEEVRVCLPFLQRQIDLIRPRLMLAVGRIAAQNLLATDTPIGRLRGAVHQFGAHGTPLIVTYHPAYLLRSPGEKRKAWADLKFVRAQLARLRG